MRDKLHMGPCALLNRLPFQVVDLKIGGESGGVVNVAKLPCLRPSDANWSLADVAVVFCERSARSNNSRNFELATGLRLEMRVSASLSMGATRLHRALRQAAHLDLKNGVETHVKLIPHVLCKHPLEC